MTQEKSINEVLMGTLDSLITIAETYNKLAYDIDTGVAELEIKGISYQLQLSLKADPSFWVGESEVRFSEGKII